jgi:hypothetical protein
MEKTRLVSLFVGLFLVCSAIFPAPARAGAGAAVGLTPSTLSFGSVTLNTTSAATTVVVTNNSGQGITIQQLSSTLPEFSVLAPALPISLGPHGSRSLQVVFRPDAALAYNGNIVVSAIRGWGGTTTAYLHVSGTGTSPAPPPTQSYLLSSSVSSLNFGNTLVGSSALQAVTLTNTGTGSVNISQVAATGAGFQFTGFSGAVTLAAGQSLALSVSFAPATTGAVAGSISVMSSATNSPGTISLSGTGIQPQVSVIPSSVSFGSVTVGVTNTQTLTIRNPGTAILSMTQASLAGAGFTSSGLALPLSIPPGGSSAFNVGFAPASVGAISGSITFISNTPNSPLMVPLSGTGTSTILQLSASPASLSFGSLTMGTSATQSVTISNTGNSSVSISQISASGAGFSTSGIALPLSLAAGQSTSFSVTFVPTSTGNLPGSVTVVSNATNSSLAVAVSGIGAAVAPTITTQPTSQTVTLGQTATFAVAANGTAPLTYQWQKNGSSITGATAASYTAPATTSADNGSAFDVVVSNSAGTVTSGTAALAVNAAAVAPAITTQPTSQTVTPGQTATFTVVASGTAPLSYQWQKNGSNISGATAASYTTPATTTADNGSAFDVVVSNSAGTVTSNGATLTVSPGSQKTYSTTFPLTENPISEGGNWINGGTTGLDWSNVQTTGGVKAWGTQVPSGLGHNDSIAVLTGAWGTNQTVQGTSAIQVSATNEIAVFLHGTITAHSAQLYKFNCSLGYQEIVKWLGPLGSISVLVHNGSVSCPSGSVLQATAVTNADGSVTLAAYINGTQVNQVTDSSSPYTAGSPGIGFWIGGGGNNNDAGISSFSAQDNTIGSAAVAPAITTQPTSQTVTTGQTATFTALANGTAPLSYQWQKNGSNISGATAASYTTPATTAADNGSIFDFLVSNSQGSVTSSAATLTVNTAAVAPTITRQPTSQTVTAAQTATFTVVANGTAPLTYQWQKNGSSISGATAASYTTPATTSTDNGSAFAVVVTNSAGTVTSSTATLAVNAAAVAPAITTQPTSQTVTAGQTATFTVAANGTAPLSYQWQKNGSSISGATAASYTTPATTTADNGSALAVVVSNSAGTVTSNGATLTVSPGTQKTYSTTFPLAENPISEGGNWINGGTTGLDWSNVQTTANTKAWGTMVPVGAGFNDSVAVLAGTWSTNQTAQGVSAIQPSATNEIEVSLHGTITAHSAQLYEFNCSLGYQEIVKWLGPLGSFTVLAHNGSVSCPSGSVFKATAVTNANGSVTLTAYINGTQVNQVTDSSSPYTAGSPGIGFWIGGGANNNDAGMSSFSAQGN